MEDRKGFFPSDKNEVFADYVFQDSSYTTANETRVFTDPKTRALQSVSATLVRDPYSLPLDSVRRQLNISEKGLDAVRRKIEVDLLSKITVSPFIDPDLESAHYRVWSEAAKYMNIPDKAFNSDQMMEDGQYQISKATPPDHICFDQVLFCEKYQSTACRIFLKEFYEAINHSTFSYLFYFRRLIKLFENENAHIKNSLINDFGGAYENESQQKIALQYDSWSKMALHYARRITETILSKPKSIPTTELDKVSKEQAAKFQGFFAIRVNAADSEINDLLEALKRDMVDNCEFFYDRYLRPAIINEKDIGESLDFIFTTTDAARSMPTLNQEVVLASRLLTSNFKSIYVDMMERISLIRDRSDAIFNLIREKKKYANYMSQLSIKGAPKQKVLREPSHTGYPVLFRSIVINTSRNNNLKSSHSNLDDLDQNSHPQYLLKDGGTITGDIFVNHGVTVGGISLSDHAHTGADGSAKIRSIDIDYDIVRKEFKSYVVEPLSVYVEQFIPDIVDGGLPVFDTVIAIELDENVDINQYEFDVLYKELD